MLGTARPNSLAQSIRPYLLAHRCRESAGSVELPQLIEEPGQGRDIVDLDISEHHAHGGDHLTVAAKLIAVGSLRPANRSLIRVVGFKQVQHPEVPGEQYSLDLEIGLLLGAEQAARVVEVVVRVAAPRPIVCDIVGDQPLVAQYILQLLPVGADRDPVSHAVDLKVAVFCGCVQKRTDVYLEPVTLPFTILVPDDLPGMRVCGQCDGYSPGIAEPVESSVGFASELAVGVVGCDDPTFPILKHGLRKIVCCGFLRIKNIAVFACHLKIEITKSRCAGDFANDAVVERGLHTVL